MTSFDTVKNQNFTKTKLMEISSRNVSSKNKQEKTPLKSSRMILVKAEKEVSQKRV
ncbi:hypothetical protein JHK87_029308 [Glycine soja]|nr:hypothetical protein JHK87_029308 [Glycine soja]KAG5005367.1 hypothetical protein JHK86_029506 [Glycine max]